MTNKFPILIWSFYEAPIELRNLSQHGGDEDWLAVIPKSFYEKYSLPLWMEEDTEFGICSVTTQVVEFELEYFCNVGDIIVIGAHA